MIRSQDDYIYKLKILIFGDRGSGKSSLVYTYVNARHPSSQFTNQQLNFTMKRQQYCTSQVNYQCRLHLWQVATNVFNNSNFQRYIKKDLFHQVNAYVFVYHDQESLLQLKNSIWNRIDFRNITTQPIYIIYNKVENKQKNRSVQKDFQSFLLNRKQKFEFRRLNFHDSMSVNQFFQNLIRKILKSASISSLESMKIRDKNNKIILKDQSYQNQYQQKRYN